MNRSFTLSLAVAAALSLAACGDGGTGPDDDGGGTNTPSRQVLTDPSYANVIQEIFNRRGCASGSCHGSSQSAGLNLTSGNSRASLVNVASTQTGVLRVIPGDANGSYLIIKVEGRQTVGDRMPPSGSALDNIDLTNLKNWITQGAKNN
jgi:hypothetical protein